jgi:acetyl esterase/lipase
MSADGGGDGMVQDGSADDLSGPGPFTSTVATVTIPGAGSNMLPATTYVPSSTAPHPLVLIAPGFQLARAQYASYATHLASWGFVVVLTDYYTSGFSIDHQIAANDIGPAITWALAQSNLAVNNQQIAVMGHSLGGKIMILAANADSRIKAVVAWDPVDSNTPSVAPERMTTISAAIAVVGETTNASGSGMPCAPAADNFSQFYAAAPSPALQATVDGADHMDWVDDQGCGPCAFCAQGTAVADVARSFTRRLNVAWLRRHLLGDASAMALLVGTGSVDVVTK